MLKYFSIIVMFLLWTLRSMNLNSYSIKPKLNPYYQLLSPFQALSIIQQSLFGSPSLKDAP